MYLCAFMCVHMCILLYMCACYVSLLDRQRWIKIICSRKPIAGFVFDFATYVFVNTILNGLVVDVCAQICWQNMGEHEQPNLRFKWPIKFLWVEQYIGTWEMPKGLACRACLHSINLGEMGVPPDILSTSYWNFY